MNNKRSNNQNKIVFKKDKFLKSIYERMINVEYRFSIICNKENDKIDILKIKNLIEVNFGLKCVGGRVGSNLSEHHFVLEKENK